MAIEKSWKAVSPRVLLANGTTEGIATLASTSGFYVKQLATIQSGPNSLHLEIKEVLSKTQLRVGPRNQNLAINSDISSYLLNVSFLWAEKQPRSSIPEKDYERAAFAEEPIVAKRTILVDEFGDYYNESNPLPIDIELVADSVELTVDLDAFDETPDSVLVVGTEDGTVSGIKHVQRVDGDGSLFVKTLNSVVQKKFDTIQITAKGDDGPTAINYRDGGLTGSIVATGNIVYDSDGDAVSLEVVNL